MESVAMLQAYAAEAGAERAEEPMEEAGMSDDIIQKVGSVHHVVELCLICYNALS